MPKPQSRSRRLPRTIVLIVDGQVHVVIHNGRDGLQTRRLSGPLLRLALRGLASWQADVEAHVVGRNRPA